MYGCRVLGFADGQSSSSLLRPHKTKGTTSSPPPRLRYYYEDGRGNRVWVQNLTLDYDSQNSGGRSTRNTRRKCFYTDPCRLHLLQSRGSSVSLRQNKAKNKVLLGDRDLHIAKFAHDVVEKGSSRRATVTSKQCTCCCPVHSCLVNKAADVVGAPSTALEWSFFSKASLLSAIHTPEDADFILGRLRREEKMLQKLYTTLYWNVPGFYILGMLRRLSSSISAEGVVVIVANIALKRAFRLSKDEGISAELRGFEEYGGSISAFMRPESERKALGDAEDKLPLPCDAEDQATQNAKAQHMLNIALSGKLPSPKVFQQNSQSHLPKRLSKSQLNINTSTDGNTTTGSAVHTTTGTKLETGADVNTNIEGNFHTKEAEDYYRAVPRNALSKEEIWKRIISANSDKAERVSSALHASEADYLRMEEELREHDLFHYRIGEISYSDTYTRRNYYAMLQLAMSLNKARWTMLDVHSQRGVKTTGAGMRLLFWKEAVNQIIEKRQMTAGQFTDSHPVLRPFAAVVEQNPHMTKTFVRGFTDARLRVLQQPGNVKQLFDYFDRYYGYFFNSLLEVTHVKDENAEHMMQHIGRAIGLTQHCVMFWKKYARIGLTMLPADLCADNHVNIALLRNISLASRDRAVRRLLYDVMCIVKTEMLHAQQLASKCPPTAWPIVMECMYANYYLGFLQRRDFNVSAMFADHNIENAGFAWYRVKKRWEWERHQSIERLVAEEAPLPFVGTSFCHRGSNYKIASGIARPQ